MIAYTDGSCSSNPNGVGSWAYVVIDDFREIIFSKVGREKKTTSNQMELMAIKELLINHPDVIQIFSDSNYSVNCINGDWKAKVNLDLILPSQEVIKKNSIELIWIRGHSGDEFNEIVDNMCNEEMKRAYFDFYGKVWAGPFWMNRSKNYEPLRKRY